MTLDPNFQIFLADSRSRVETALDKWLPPAEIKPQRLHEAMRYATLSDGKRVRPVLVYAAGTALNTELKKLDGAACAVELIHAYSLIHDDLPAMDDDDLRRGRPTCHKAFDDATAILAGDALQPLAFKILVEDPEMSAPADCRIAMIRELANASGSRGMVGGQAIDIEATGKQIDLAQLENMHIHKTGALIRASIKLGALCSQEADSDKLKRLDRYAKCIGLAFQVRDDILDIEGDTAVIGKTQGKDQADDKSTYPSLLGLDAAKDMTENLLEESLDNLSNFGEGANHLRDLATYIVKRQR